MRREITSLALVKSIYTQYGYKRDYIENFVPFIANLVYRLKISSIQLAKLDDFIEVFRKEFGLSIPYHPMVTILGRCKKRGLFKQEYGQLISMREKIMEYDFADLVKQKEIRINELLMDIESYANNKLLITVSIDEIQNVLLSYLSLHDMDIIFATQGKAIITAVKVSPSLKYVLANYVSYVKDCNQVMFNLIVEVAVGHILANTILYSDKLQQYAGRFKGLIFYIDAKFIFRLLGYEGELFRSAYVELLIALREQGAELCIFDHTYEEITGVLRGALRYVDTVEFDPAKASSVMRFYKNAGKNKADIQQDLATIDDRLKDFGICVLRTPSFTKTEKRQISESDLEVTINKIYSERIVDYNPVEKKSTIEKDIKSVSAIYHLRQASRSFTLKGAKYFFLTSNSGLAYAARSFELKASEGDKFVPACVTDVFIGTLVWMQSPVRWVDINQKRFLADCMALLTPTSAFLKRLIEEAQKLKDVGRLNDDEFMVVRSSIFVQEVLMKETYGDAEAINAESIEDVLNRIRNEASVPLQQTIKEKDAELIELQRKYKSDVEKKDKYRAELENVAVGEAKNFTNIISTILWAFFIVTLTVSWVGWPSWIKIVLKLLSCLFAIAGFGFGKNIKNIREIIFLKRLIKLREKYKILD